MSSIIGENYTEIYDFANERMQKSRATKFWLSLVLPCVATLAVCAVFVVLAAKDILSPWVGWAFCGAVTLACIWFVAVRADYKKAFTARNDLVKQLPTANRVKHRAQFVDVTSEVKKAFDFDCQTLRFEGDEEWLLDVECDCPFCRGKVYDIITVGNLVVAYREVRNERA